MQIEELLAIIERTLEPLGGRTEEAAAYERPAILFEKFYIRPVRLSRVPWLGRAQSLVLVAHQPADVAFGGAGQRDLWSRLFEVAAGRLPLRNGPTIALTAVVLATEPLRPEDTPLLETTLRSTARKRTVPLGVFRVNLEQAALAYALRRGPRGLFPEPELLAEAFSRSLRQFARPIEGAGIL